MEKLPNDRVIRYRELEELPDDTRARISGIFKIFSEGLGTSPLTTSGRVLKPGELGIVFPDRVYQAIYFAAMEGYHLNNFTLPNGKRPLEAVKAVFEEHSKRQGERRHNFIEPIKTILEHLNGLEAAYAGVAGDKTDFIAGIEKKYAGILGVGSAEGVEKYPVKIPGPPALDPSSTCSWSKLADDREKRTADPKRGSGDGKVGKWLD